jgi:hypothetical protein
LKIKKKPIALGEENQRNIYPLVKGKEIESETTITIYNKMSLE